MEFSYSSLRDSAARLGRRVTRALARPFHRLVLAQIRATSPWEVIAEVDVAPQAFGLGSKRPFTWYFQGSCDSAIGSVEEMCEWLRGCTYESDQLQFGVADVWLHPAEFERTRKGDCDDHALWAWRKLTELGYEAELFSGEVAGLASERHVWVVFKNAEGQQLLCETIAKRAGKMILPLETARKVYAPFFSVDSAFMCKCYGGFVHHLQVPRVR